MQVQRVQNNPQQFTGVSYSFPEGVAKKNWSIIKECLPDEARHAFRNALRFNNELAHVDLNMILSPKGLEQSIKHGEKVYTGSFEPIALNGKIMSVKVNDGNLDIAFSSEEAAKSYYEQFAKTSEVNRPLAVAYALDKSLSKLNVNA